MAVKVSISLEGAAQVEAQLKALGPAGEAALKQFQTAVNKVEIGKIDQGIKNVGQSLEDVTKTFLNFGSVVRASFAGIALTAVTAFVRAQVDNVEALQKSASAVGLSVQQYQVYKKAAQEAGLETEKLDVAFRKFAQTVDTEGKKAQQALAEFTKTLAEGGQLQGLSIQFKQLGDTQGLQKAAQEAAQLVQSQLQKAFKEEKLDIPVPDLSALTTRIGSAISQLTPAAEKLRNQLRDMGIEVPIIGGIGEALDVVARKQQSSLKELNVRLLDTNGNIKSTGEAFLDWVAGLRRMGSEAEQQRKIIELFGRQAGPALVKFLKEANFEEIAKRVDFISPEAIKSAEEARLAFISLDAAFSKLSRSFAVAIAPTLTPFLNDLSKALKDLGPAFENTGKVIGGVITTISNSLAGVAKDINSVFGTNLKGIDIAFGIFVALIIDKIGLLSKAFVLLGATIKALPIVAIAAALIEALTPPGEVSVKLADAQKEMDALFKVIAKGGPDAEAAKQRLFQLQQGLGAASGEAQRSKNIWEQSFDSLAASARKNTDSAVKDLDKLKAATGPKIGFVVAPGAGPLTEQERALQTKVEGTAAADKAVAPLKDAQATISAIITSVSEALTKLPETITSALQPLSDALTVPFLDADETIGTVFDGIAEQAEQMSQRIITAAQNAASAVSQIGQGFTGFGGQPLGAPFASGGQVFGPWGRDKVPAWLTNKEWVINTKSVDYYGSAFFAALNAMRIPRDLLSKRPIIPQFAAGGQVNASQLTLVLDGGEFAMQTSEETLSRLRRAAMRARIASVGRAPGWVR